MKLSFHGAARTVTGSKHIVHLSNGKKILLDCGLFQGMGKETLLLNGQWGFEPDELTYVIISHAHIDHVGLLPKLVKDGYAGDIYIPEASLELAKILLLDSARIQESDVEHVNRMRIREGRVQEKPLYTEDDARAMFDKFRPIAYDAVHKIDEDITLLYRDCGHILGSASVNLTLMEHGKEVRLTFSGDIGRYNDLLLRSPDTFPQADYIIMESTYGDRLHDMVTPGTDILLAHIKHTCLEKRGRLVIPAFSVGRTQEILYLLNRLEVEGRLPALSYYVDSPLSIEATEIIKHHEECFNKEVQNLLKKDHDVFAFKGLRYVQSVDESIGLNSKDEPCVIISASGMAEAGRVKHHIAHAINNANNTILIVGYCEPQSLGARLRNGAKEVGIYGVRYPVLASVGVINSLSAHGDYEDLCQWLACQNPKLVKKLFIVHGEYDAQMNFRERLIRKGFEDVIIPKLHETIGLGI